LESGRGGGEGPKIDRLTNGCGSFESDRASNTEPLLRDAFDSVILSSLNLPLLRLIKIAIRMRIKIRKSRVGYNRLENR
jgi:hypothetical protein